MLFVGEIEEESPIRFQGGELCASAHIRIVN